MAAILSNLRNAATAAIVLGLALLIILGISDKSLGLNLSTKAFWAGFFRWIHVVAGVMWIGLLYYFNFVQMPSMPKIPDEQKPAVSKVIAPTALFWFRWAAMVTFITGLIVAHLASYGLVKAITLGLGDGWGGKATIIGIGMWLGAIMWFNVWFIIWPNQKKALGIVTVPADQKAKAARLAMLVSRTNMVLSVPMLFCMVMAKGWGN
jgi:uncharacterized membrane protein